MVTSGSGVVKGREKQNKLPGDGYVYRDELPWDAWREKEDGWKIKGIISLGYTVGFLIHLNNAPKPRERKVREMSNANKAVKRIRHEVRNRQERNENEEGRLRVRNDEDGGLGGWIKNL